MRLFWPPKIVRLGMLTVTDVILIILQTHELVCKIASMSSFAMFYMAWQMAKNSQLHSLSQISRETNAFRGCHALSMKFLHISAI